MLLHVHIAMQLRAKMYSGSLACVVRNMSKKCRGVALTKRTLFVLTHNQGCFNVCVGLACHLRSVHNVAPDVNHFTESYSFNACWALLSGRPFSWGGLIVSTDLSLVRQIIQHFNKNHIMGAQSGQMAPRLQANSEKL